MRYFVGQAEDYVQSRDNQMLRNWVRYMAFYLHVKQPTVSREEIEKMLTWSIREGKIDYTDPIVSIFRKDEHRDRYRDQMRWTQFLKEIRDRKLIMAPTLTCYLPDEECKSELAIFTWDKFLDRKKTKKAGQLAKSQGDMQTAINKGNEQNLQKTLINSISGALTIGTTPIANRSGHSTLTSTCRTATAFANANTERLLCGRRYFPTGESVIENICSVLADVDEEKLQGVLERHQLHLVTPDELMDALKYSYSSYWRSEVWEARIRDFVSKLTPLQCSIYLYMGDFYHLRQYNPEFVRRIISDVRKYQDQPHLSPEETEAEMKTLDAYYVMFVTSMVATHLDGRSIYDDIHKDKPYFGMIGACSQWVKKVLEGYADYFECFWKTKHLPGETALFPHVLRRGVLGGDTDSTLFTVLEWVRWYHQTAKVDDDTKVTAQFIIYLLCITVKHALAMTSGHIGVSAENIFLLEMKNEFYFDVFSPSNRTKHYVNLKSACEGISYKEKELESKGVALKNSKAHISVMDMFTDMVYRILDNISQDIKIILKDFIRDVAQIEANIYTSVMHGDMDHLPSRMIKAKEAYTIPMSSDYANYELWEAVFAEKYGRAPEPPYDGVRIAMDLPNPTAVRAWLSTLKDQTIADKMQLFLDKYDRKAIASIILPYETIASRGIPDELKPIINIRKIIFASTEPYYILGEMLGHYRVNKWLTKMYLDDHLELIPRDLVQYFDGSETVDLSDIKKKAKSAGQYYEQWDLDASRDEEDMDEDEEKTIDEDDEESEE